MNFADVIINLPTNALNQVFTYAIPEKLQGKVKFGYRVLVEFGNRNIEAFIIDLKKESKVKNVKKLVHVLDHQPVFNKELLELAYFIADNYLCPIAMALNAMIPRAITNTKSQVIIPLVSKQEFIQIAEAIKYTDFMEKLWQDTEMTWANSKKYISEEELEVLTSHKMIKVIYKYTKKISPTMGYLYTLNAIPKDLDINKLARRAPRQAEILTILQENQVSADWLENNFNKSTVKSLLEKGYIQKVLSPTSFSKSSFSLTPEQKIAINTLKDDLEQGYKEFLLFGVTGSGKTEVYINIAKHCIEQGKTVLLLIPEIALTRHLVEVISKRVSNLAVLHSNMSNGERLNEWERIRSGEVGLVLGTRSAIFAPMPDLALIIIDEEQEATYKQEDTPKYDAREIARQRGKYNDALILYGSATPSVELFYRVQKGEVAMLRLDKRIGEAKLPSVHIEDMRLKNNRTNSIISPYLEDRIKLNLANKEQTILFINRRGYSPVT
ncbi:MAG: primosomal protein N', partial [Syntrophomonadaceae bacterium]|nr:primosomal protein N' [Syntrophomonadaceae bacterium]